MQLLEAMEQSPNAPPRRLGNDSACAPRASSKLFLCLFAAWVWSGWMQCGPAHEAHGHGQANGSGEDDVVLFAGSGTTAAVAKLVSALELDRKKSRFSRSTNT